MTRKPYPSDVSDDEWMFVAPYLTLMKAAAPQRQHDLREIFNGLRWLVRAGAPWRLLPHDLPPWEAVYQQTQRWLAAGCFEAVVHDLRELLRQAQAGSKALKRVEGRLAVPELCRELGVSSATFYKWRAKYGDMDTSLITRMEELEA